MDKELIEKVIACSTKGVDAAFYFFDLYAEILAALKAKPTDHNCPLPADSGIIEWHNGKVRFAVSFKDGMPFSVKDAIEAHVKPADITRRTLWADGFDSGYGLAKAINRIAPEEEKQNEL